MAAQFLRQRPHLRSALIVEQVNLLPRIIQRLTPEDRPAQHLDRFAVAGQKDIHVRQVATCGDQLGEPRRVGRTVGRPEHLEICRERLEVDEDLREERTVR